MAFWFVGNTVQIDYNFYPPQGKVMFSEAFVCPGDLPLKEVLYLKGGLRPMGGLPWGRESASRWGLPKPPSQYWYLVAATAAVGTHPTEMHFCSHFHILHYLFYQIFQHMTWMARSARFAYIVKRSLKIVITSDDTYSRTLWSLTNRGNAQFATIEVCIRNKTLFSVLNCVNIVVQC